VLSSEFSSGELRSLQMLPKKGFRWCEVSSQPLAVFFQYLQVVNLITHFLSTNKKVFHGLNSYFPAGHPCFADRSSPPDEEGWPKDGVVV
jgi:hypothetical protein